MIPDTNRILLVLRQWEAEGLMLTMEGDKIKPGRKLASWERELILEHRDIIVEEIPKMSYLSKEQCIPFLRESYRQEIRKTCERLKGRRKKSDFGHVSENGLHFNRC